MWIVYISMTKSIRASLFIAFFGLLFGLLFWDMAPFFQASIIQDGDDRGKRIYYEDFSSLAAVEPGLYQTQIVGKNLVQKPGAVAPFYSPVSSIETFGPVVTSDVFTSLNATISNELSGIRYVSFRFLDASFFPISVGGETVFDSSDLPVDMSSITQNTIYL